ncbi:MAG: hypothetical protein AB7N76_32925 [Planctomycetota bacterium]
MPIRLHVQNEQQVVVPLRFDRAVTGRPSLTAPWIDDRGWRVARPSGFNQTEARGPLFGVMVGDTVRIKVVREDLDETAPLFAVAGQSAEPQIEVTEPAGGGPLPSNGIVKVKAIASTSSGQTLEIRLGSATGPVLAEAEPHVFERLTVNLTPHIVTIHQAASGGSGFAPITETELREVVKTAQAIWRPAGVHLNAGATRTHVINGAIRDDYALVTTNPATVGGMAHIYNQGRVANTINVYFVAFVHDSLGYGFRKETASAMTNNLTGIILATVGRVTVNTGPPVTFDEAAREENGADLIHVLGSDLAHEVGHLLTLSHANLVNGVGRRDTYDRRQLMHPQPYLPHTSEHANIRLNDVGAGTVQNDGHRRGVRGALITLKDLGQHSTDGEVKAARDRIGHANLYA